MILDRNHFFVAQRSGLFQFKFFLRKSVFCDIMTNPFGGMCLSGQEPNYRYFCLNMKLVDVLVLSLAVAFLIIGIHQTMVLGFGKAYWAIMLSLGLYFVFNFRKRK
jgi:hypothetical protein